MEKRILFYLDDIGIANQLINWGAQSITTNNPGQLNKISPNHIVQKIKNICSFR